MEPLPFLVRLLAPDAAQGAYNDWQIVSTSTQASWVLWLVAVGLLLSVLVSTIGQRRLPRSKRVLLLGLRSAVAFTVFLLFLKPAVELRAVSRVRTRVALLLDNSRSMSLATPSGTRAELVSRHLEKNAGSFEALAQRAIIEPMLFGGRTQMVDQIPGVLEATEGKTDIDRALAEATSPSSSRELGAIILYSDGADNQGLSPEIARRRAEKIGVPIYTIGLASSASTPDLAVRHLHADEFAFVHNTVKVDVEVEERGFGLDHVDVTLRQDGTILQTKTVRLVDGHGVATFDFKPRQTGRLVYQVSVPVQDGESVESNNEKTIVLKVIRDRIRVLQVAGRPSWDQRFLREYLKRNPNIDLISFFILRSTTDRQKASQDELALIPFPVNDLFTTELGSFDIVIYQNFSYRPYHMAHYLRNIRDYVMKGGSFIMLGGDNAFEDGAYAGTPIEDVLPVQLGGALPWTPDVYRARLTQQGRRHPIMRIGEPGEPPDGVFQRLPELTGINHAIELAPNAQALLVHPRLPGNPPVVAVREVGEGLTMSIATDSLWFWRFVSVGEGGAGREFDRFWSNALRWLTRDPELSRVRIRPERAVSLSGDPVAAEVRVLGPDYRGLAEARAIARLVRTGTPGRQEVVAEADVVTGPEGSAVVLFNGVAPGTYVARIEASKDGEQIGQAQEPIIVEAADLELQAPFLRPDLLRALSESSEGEFGTVEDPLPEIRLKDPERVEVDRAKRIPFWDTFLALGTLLGLAATEWWLRRRWGLL